MVQGPEDLPQSVWKCQSKYKSCHLELSHIIWLRMKLWYFEGKLVGFTSRFFANSDKKMDFN